MEKKLGYLYLGDIFEKTISQYLYIATLDKKVFSLDVLKKSIDDVVIEDMRKARLEKIAFLKSERDKCTGQTFSLLRERNSAVDSTSGMTVKEIDEQLKMVAVQSAYMSGLLDGICTLFGHEAKSSDNSEFFVCECCGKVVSQEQYIDSHQKAFYHNVAPYNYMDSSQGVISGDVDSSYPVNIPDVSLHKIQTVVSVPTIEALHKAKVKTLY